MSNLVQEKIDGRIVKNPSELNKEHWVFLLALINDHAFRGTQIEIAFEIKQIIQSKLQGNT
tara:strand:- start:543 stop:725 length:183 start_codon:yes stop_codon:yes gene_type:complete